jgi:hypothetical protein
MAVLEALCVAGWSALDAAEEPPLVGSAKDDATPRAALEAENAWLRSELARLRAGAPRAGE